MTLEANGEHAETDGMTLGEWLGSARGRLERAGIESASIEAQLLAAHVLQVDRAFVLTHPEHGFPELAGETLLQRREALEPLAYILGGREFYGRRFRVRPGVLIPRQETETLVEAALAFLPDEPRSVLDLGSGSGCIAITLKLERPSADVTAVDVSPIAVEVSEENAWDLGAVVRCLLSDGFDSLGDATFDLIVTNPPYIGFEEDLPREVRDYEPGQALFAGPTGFEYYERLAQTAAPHLNEGGRLMMEVGYRQAREVALIFESAGWFVDGIEKDFSGVERVVSAEPTTV